MSRSKSVDYRLHGKKRPGRRGHVCEKDLETVCNVRKAFNLPCSNCKYFEDCKEVQYGNCK